MDHAFDEQRDAMVHAQIAARGVTGRAVLEAIARVPRHLFVPGHLRGAAYEDRPLPIGCGQTISQPYMVGLMTALLDLRPEDRVLEIGAGSGYQTAVLAELAREVLSIERHAPLAETARERLAALGYGNVEIRCGDGTLGAPDRAPFDAILVTAGSPAVPPCLRGQLAEGGRLVCPVGGRSVQTLVRIERTGDRFRATDSIECIFVPLVGADGWPAGPEDEPRRP